MACGNCLKARAHLKRVADALIGKRIGPFELVVTTRGSLVLDSKTHEVRVATGDLKQLLGHHVYRGQKYLVDLKSLQACSDCGAVVSYEAMFDG